MLKKIYKTLPSYKARALIYQSASLSDNLEKKLDLLILLNDLFKKDDIENAFSEELSSILSDMKKKMFPQNILVFIKLRLIYQQKKKKTSEQ